LKADILDDPEVREALRRIVEYEKESEAKYGKPICWDWQDVAVDWRIIKKILLAGYLNAIGGKHKAYLLKNREEVERLILEWEREPMGSEAAEAEAEATAAAEIPQDLFEPIVGYEEVKQLLRDAIASPRPVHVLLCGPPASAKSMFLLELDRLPKSHFALGGQTSQVGLAEEMFQHAPKYLIIDELDDMPRYEQSVLKSLMESGVITVRKHNVKLRQKFSTWVFGACNHPERLSDAVLSRFIKVHFEPYTPEQFKEIVISVLTKREGVDVGLAEYIADRVGKFSRDPRDAVALSRVARTKEKVDKYTELIFASTPATADRWAMKWKEKMLKEKG
jgi:Holliday junction DNA helicase RuvB